MIMTITKWLITNNAVSCFAVLSSLLLVSFLFVVAGNLNALSFFVSPKTDMPASKKPNVAIK